MSNIEQRHSSPLHRGIDQIRRAASGVFAEFSKTVDLDRWSVATGWQARLRAVSWPRAAVLAGLASVIVATTITVVLPRGIRGYPPPLPSQETLTLRDQGLKRFKSTPPPGLIEANRSIPTGRTPS